MSEEAPERIWAWHNGRTCDQMWESRAEYYTHGIRNPSEYVEYVRADLYESQAARIEALENEIRGKNKLLEDQARLQRMTGL